MPDRAARVCVLPAVLLGIVVAASGAAPRTEPPAGLRESVPSVHALVGARIVVSPEATLERGTLVLRDGVIVAAGENVEPPADARLWQLGGKTIYPGLIDAYGELSSETSQTAVKKESGAGYWNANIVPQARAAAVYAADAAANRKLRSQGITARLIGPSFGIVKGTSALVTTGDADGRQTILAPDAALHFKLTTSRGSREYPNSPMGALTLVRQAFFDAGWYRQAWAAYEQDPQLPRPERSDALAALAHYLGRQPPVVIDAADELYFLRADAIADEFQLAAIIRGSGSEYKRLDAIKATGRAVIVPVNFPRAPNVATPEAALAVSLARLMHWELAPENPGRLDAAGVKIALTSFGLSDPATFLTAVRKAVARGLKPEAALRALTTTPAELFGAGDRLGTIEPGKAGNLVVADGPLFDKKTKIVETWVDGRRYEVAAEPQVEVRGSWRVELTGPGGQAETVSLELSGQPGRLEGKIARGDKSSKLIAPQLDGLQFAASFKGEPVQFEGIVRLSATVSDSEPAAREAATAGEPSWLGSIAWADGQNTPITAKRAPTAAATAGEGDKKPDDAAGKPEQAAKDEADKKAAEAEAAKPAMSVVNFPLGAFGRVAPPEQPAAVLFKGATLWTSGPQGRLDNADLLIGAGKVTAVGSHLEAPPGAIVIDCQGKHVSPGIIDCHSHVATDGGVNESGQTITAEVRIGDFIDPDDVNIYRQLGGGVTSSNILHGSANTIGGQNQVLKFRWGAGPEEMKFAGAKPGIKFALGENVKQSNWGTRGTGRYPQTRMGVEQLVRDAFQAARQYRARWDAWNRTKTGLPPRVDLELEALAEVVEGKRIIHCHSYRQDEILALIRTCEAFGVTIGTFQHVLEGYKVADAIARHGAGGSSFSDWWAYKFEVFDAIPYNGALLHNAGVVVSFNSDNAELARRLNLEAAKAMKYGGVKPEEALKFVTLNPARQLRIDDRVGSLEVGKDADLAVWSGSPLSTYSRCEQTWVDGRKYFDLDDDRALRKAADELRARLVQRVLASGDPIEKPGDNDQDRWPREDIFCGHGDHDHLH